MDFLRIETTRNRYGGYDITPHFVIRKSSDLMIRGKDFYAVWDENNKRWSTEEQDLVNLVDDELRKESEKLGPCNVKYMWDSSSGSIDLWHKYCQKQMRDNYRTLDETLVFSNTETSKTNYSSKSLPYPIERGIHNSYDKLMDVLYSTEDRHKIEWAIGAVISGESKNVQKFIVLYGPGGTGKSTVINIIQKLFVGYYTVFDAKAVGSLSASFALEPFNNNPLVAIQHDGDLSKIEDNTRLNSIISHEEMTINEKYKSTYTNAMNCMIFLGTNKPVKITDAKSGIIRRLIDVSPTGNKIPKKEYERLVKQVDFELGAIAWHCREVFLEDPNYYDDYVAVNMLYTTNDFFNFVQDSYLIFSKEDGISAKAAWELYKEYCEDARVQYPFNLRVFKDELKNYFEEYYERYTLEDGSRIRSYYRGLRLDKLHIDVPEKVKTDSTSWLNLVDQSSLLDDILAKCPAQEANEFGTPVSKWSECTTVLSNIDTHKLHYVKLHDDRHIIVDFDIPDEYGNKSLDKNMEAASKWPATYAELSKSGSGIHLHYIYTGPDVTKLSQVYDDYIEVKVYKGNSALRRKLTKCNTLSIANINSGLPLKGDKMVNEQTIKNERQLRILIKRALNKEIHASTKPNIDFVDMILDKAYRSNIKYDVSDLRNDILVFASRSTNQADYCVKLVSKMKFKSEEPSINTDNNNAPIVFFDVEVFSNLLLINWKYRGPDNKVVRMINPKPAEVESLMQNRLIGFNCRKYDNHILWAAMMGYNNEAIYRLSSKLINNKNRGKFDGFAEAYNVSYADVYDFSSKKQSLKKFEIDLKIHHQELGLPWDKPVDESLWPKVAEYCDYDVLATEAVFDDRQEDFTAREILADLSELTVNDTTNSHTTKIIFGNNRKPQGEFEYRFMGTDELPLNLDGEEYIVFNENNKPIFPGYQYKNGVSTYRDEIIGEGGYVYAELGTYTNVALLDIASMHPHSIIAEELFGPRYTKRFKDLVDARIHIKHREWDIVRTLLDGKLSKYVDRIISGELSHKALANALKIAINSVYGLTAASFEHPFKDPKNIDNIVAKRGALFMVNLKHEVQKRGYVVVHIKTDSIKIADATPEIIQFVMDFGKRYGYSFEHEATYDKICLVNDAVYIARYKSADGCNDIYGYIPGENMEHEHTWTATGTQFAVPYVFKTLFSHENIEFEDLCETKSVTSALYLDMNEQLPDVSDVEKELDKRLKKKDITAEEIADYQRRISIGHDYKFVGKVGLFCPVKQGSNGGLLCRDANGKFDSAVGAKGYRWLESEMVKALGMQDNIDKNYYRDLVDKAADAISKYCDFEWFVSDEPVCLQGYSGAT